ncbi:MAG: hypothetical protein JWQ30_9, partial [Sediminibacterium sp.]|nr:hypothetical protein [Sediminibacterium sp.]
MKKTYHLLVSIGIILASAIIFYSCKKQDNQTEDDVSVFRTAVEVWQKQESITANPAQKAKITAVVEKLNYSSAARLTNLDGGIEFIIEVSDLLNRKSQFLSLLKNNDQYSLKGIYQSTSLSLIKNFFVNRTIQKNDTIMLRTLDRYPIAAWTTNYKGLVEFQGKSVRKGETPDFTHEAPSRMPRLNYIQDPDQCIDWYWVYYNEATGQIVAIFYDGSTGKCGDGGG